MQKNNINDEIVSPTVGILATMRAKMSQSGAHTGLDYERAYSRTMSGHIVEPCVGTWSDYVWAHGRRTGIQTVI